MEDNDRIIKNIIMIIILIITIGGLVFTGYMAYKNLKTTETVVTNEFEDNKPPMNGEEPPENRMERKERNLQKSQMEKRLHLCLVEKRLQQ